MTKKPTHPRFYATPEGAVNIEVYFENENLWLSQKQLGTLFDVERSVITKHLKNIFEAGELEEESNVQNLHILRFPSSVNRYFCEGLLGVSS